MGSDAVAWLWGEVHRAIRAAVRGSLGYPLPGSVGPPMIVM